MWTEKRKVRCISRLGDFLMNDILRANEFSERTSFNPRCTHLSIIKVGFIDV